MGKIIEVKLADLKDSFYVRVRLDDDRLQLLWSLRDAGVELPPILITKDYRIVRGRHRVYVERELMKKETIKAIVTEETDFIKLVAMAVEENSGGSLPLTKEDLFHTMVPLVQKGISLKKVVSAFPFLPHQLIRTCYRHAEWRENNKKYQQARSLVIYDNLTVNKAAEVVGIDQQKLQKFLDKKADNNGGGRLVASKKELGQRFSHFNRCNGQKVRDLFKLYDDGEIGKRDADSIFNYLGNLIINQNRMYADWQKRWEYKK